MASRVEGRERAGAVASALGLALPPDLVAAIGVDGARTGDWAGAPGRAYTRQLAAARTERRAAGAYYTPRYLTELVVDRVLDPWAADSAEQFLERRILDPACGAGAFLIAVLDAAVARWAGSATAAERARFARAVVGNCLFGIDTDPIAADSCRLALALAAGRYGVALPGNGLLDADSLDGGGAKTIEVGDAILGPDPAVARAGSFDAVVGNPPWGQKGFRWTPRQRDQLRERYRVGRGVVDPFAVFIERGLALCRDGGRLALVVPDVLLLKNQRLARDVLLDDSCIEWLIHSGRAFADVNLDTAVVVARRGAAPPDHEVAIWTEVPPSWRTVPPATTRTPQSVFRELPGHCFNLYLSDGKLELLRRLRAARRFDTLFETHEGVHSGNARKKLFVDERPPGPAARLVLGRDEVGPCSIRWGGRWLDRRPEALDRGAGDYANLGRPEWHETAKLVVRRTGDRVVSAHDPEGLWVSNNLFVAVPRGPMQAEELRAFAVLLNSRLMTWYFRALVPRTGRLFAELKLVHLRDFPVPDEGAWQQAIAGLEGCYGRQDSDAERDRLVADAFGLDDAERQLLSPDPG